MLPPLPLAECSRYLTLCFLKTCQTRVLEDRKSLAQERALQPNMSADYYVKLYHSYLPDHDPYPSIPCLFMCLAECLLNIVIISAASTSPRSVLQVLLCKIKCIINLFLNYPLLTLNLCPLECAISSLRMTVHFYPISPLNLMLLQNQLQSLSSLSLYTPALSPKPAMWLNQSSDQLQHCFANFYTQCLSQSCMPFLF